MASDRRLRSGKSQTTFSSDYPVGQDYDGLLRALEESFERRGKHELSVVDYQPLDNQGALFRLRLKSKSLDGLTPP